MELCYHHEGSLNHVIYKLGNDAMMELRRAYHFRDLKSCQ